MTTPLTIPDALALREQSPRGVTFLGEEGETGRWTYGELAAVARRTAGAWDEVGVAPGDRVGLLGSTTPELVAAIFGCWALGAVAVPLAVPLRLTSAESLLEEVRTRADKASISALGVDDRVGAFLDVSSVVSNTITLSELAEGGRDVPLASPDPDEPALIQFTSGSTARPKGATLSHRTLISNGVAAQEHVGITSEDVAVSWLPLYHDFGLIGLTLWPLIFDMATHLMAPETFIASPKRWVQALSRYGATITAAPNFAYGLATRALRILDEPIDLSRLRVAANGAEPVDLETIEAFVAAAEPTGFRPEAMLPVYGLAEGTLGVASPSPLEAPPPWWVDALTLATEGRVEEREPDVEGARPLVSVGHPIPGVEIAVRSKTGQHLGDGRVGEIFLRTEHAMLGYWDDPDQTEEAVVDGWVRTGDLGVTGPDGLYITGRAKDMIIVGGRNIYPEDAERVTQRLPGVRKGNAVAFGILERAREGLVVIAETRLSGDDATHLAKQIASEVRTALRVAADQVVLLLPGSLPKTPSGKLQRGLTRKLFEAEQFLNDVVAATGRHLHGGAGAEPAY